MTVKQLLDMLKLHHHDDEIGMISNGFFYDVEIRPERIGLDTWCSFDDIGPGTPIKKDSSRTALVLQPERR